MGDHFIPIGRDDFYLAVHLFQGEALTLARELRGMTMTELANYIGKTPGAISQFESGRARPDVTTLKAITLALGLPANFFSNRGANRTLNPDKCHFRKLRSASQKDKRKLLATASLLSNLIERIEEHVELPSINIPIFGDYIRSYDDIDDIADEVRKFWNLGPGPIPSMVHLLEAHGIIVNTIPDACEEVDAFSTWHQGRPFVFLTTTKGAPSRQRFDGAHELGHLVIHVDAIPGDKELENQANRFAGAFLFPKKQFQIEWPKRFDINHVFELKKRWRVSAAALIKRAYDLECISEATYTRAFRQLSTLDYRSSEPFEPEPEKPILIQEALTVAIEEDSLDSLLQAIGLRANDLDLLIPRTYEPPLN